MQKSSVLPPGVAYCDIYSGCHPVVLNTASAEYPPLASHYSNRRAVQMAPPTGLCPTPWHCFPPVYIHYKCLLPAPPPPTPMESKVDRTACAHCVSCSYMDFTNHGRWEPGYHAPVAVPIGAIAKRNKTAGKIYVTNSLLCAESEGLQAEQSEMCLSYMQLDNACISSCKTATLAWQRCPRSSEKLGPFFLEIPSIG